MMVLALWLSSPSPPGKSGKQRQASTDGEKLHLPSKDPQISIYFKTRSFLINN